MSHGASFLLRLARWISGEQRREWVNAMAAEAEALGPAGNGWAIGCLWAAAKDRLRRERTTMALILAAPIATTGLQTLIFLPAAWLVQHELAPAVVLYLAAIAVPLPLAWLLGRWCSHAFLPAACISYGLLALLPGFMFWITFGESPWIFFSKGATLNGMPVLLGLTVTCVLWIGSAWLGSRSHAKA